jgi:hypothetical protein
VESIRCKLGIIIKEVDRIVRIAFNILKLKRAVGMKKKEICTQL